MSLLSGCLGFLQATVIKWLLCGRLRDRCPPWLFPFFLRMPLCIRACSPLRLAGRDPGVGVRNLLRPCGLCAQGPPPHGSLSAPVVGVGAHSEAMWTLPVLFVFILKKNSVPSTVLLSLK